MKNKFSKIVLRSVSAAIVLSTTPAVLFAAPSDAKVSKSESNGVVSSISGNAYIIRNGKTIPLTAGMEIREKDVVKTSNGGNIQINFPDKTQTTIGGGSSVEITTYRFNSNEAKVNLTVLNGSIETKAGEIATRNPENFSIKTENSIITAKGTGVTLQAQVTSAGDKVMTQSGDVSVQPLKNAGGGIEVKAGQMTVVTESKITEAPRAINVQDNASMGQSLSGNSRSVVTAPITTPTKTVEPAPVKVVEQSVLPTMSAAPTTVLPTIQETRAEAPQIKVVVPDVVKPDINLAPVVTPVESFKANISSDNTGKISVTDPNGDKLSFSLSKLPTNGTATISQDGTYTYRANSGFYGTDTFEVLVDDGKEGGKVSATITALNARPVASNLSATLSQNMQTSATAVSATDSNGDALAYSNVTNPSHGQLTFNSNGTYTYTPNYNYTGSDTFTYKANDGLADSETKTVTLTVGANLDHPASDPLNQASPGASGSLTPPTLGEGVDGLFAVSAPSTDTNLEWGVWSSGDRPFAQLSTQNDISGYWVKGTLTPNSVIENYIRNDQVVTYSGTNSMLGNFSEGGTKSAITSSSVNLTVNFGATNPVSGNINFSSATQSVALNVNGGTVVPNAISLASSAVSNTTGAGAGNVAVSSFAMNGSFYGSNANSIGANLNGSGTKGANQVSFQGALGAKR